jgi:hypothetical protein
VGGRIHDIRFSWFRCNIQLSYKNGYSSIDFTFPEPLVNSGDTVRIELDYSLVTAVCISQDGDLYLYEHTSNQWLDPSMVQSTVYAVCMPSASTASWNPDYTRSEWDGQLLDDTMTSAYRPKHSSALRKY